MQALRMMPVTLGIIAVATNNIVDDIIVKASPRQHCNTPHHTATHYITLQHTTSHCNTLHHTIVAAATNNMVADIIVMGWFWSVGSIN